MIRQQALAHRKRGSPSACACTLAIALVSAVLVVPASASALEVQEGVSRQMTFRGDGCGSFQNKTFSVPTGARRVRVAPVASPLVSDSTGQPVARLTVAQSVSGTDRRIRSVQFVATGSDDVCARPASYPRGWRTRPITISFGYLIKRPVFFRSFNDARTTKSRIRPRVIRFAKRGLVTAMSWAAWNGPRARGSGRIQVGASSAPAKVSLQEAGGCYGQVRYQLLRVRVIGRLPTNVRRRYSERYGCF